jgi:hypothetical protein
MEEATRKHRHILPYNIKTGLRKAGHENKDKFTGLVVKLNMDFTECEHNNETSLRN